MNKLFTLLLFIFMTQFGYSQSCTGTKTIVAQETFDDTSNLTPTTGDFFNDGSYDYWDVADVNGIPENPTGFDGSFFAAQDVDATDGSGALPQTFTLTFDVSGYSNLSFSGLFADQGENTKMDDADFVSVTASLDGGGEQPLILVESTASGTNSDMQINGTVLTSAAQEFSKDILGSGASLVLTVKVSLDSGYETISFDNFTICGDANTCDASVTAGTATCDDKTPYDDTYSATFTVNVGSESEAFAVSSSSGTPSVTTVSSNSEVTVSDVAEGDDVVLTISNSNCTIESRVLTPNCSPDPRINEIHYDNDGTDVDEFVEIFFPSSTPIPPSILADYTIKLSNQGADYASISLDDSEIVETSDDYGYYYVWAGPSNGIQNGPNDGVALCHFSEGLLQFWSYEGVITGTTTGSCTYDVTSTEMDNSQASDNAIGISLQFIPTNPDPVISVTNNMDGQWQLLSDTRGGTNQLVAPISFGYISAQYEKGYSYIRWTTYSETEDNYFEIEHSLNGQTWEKVGQVDGLGLSSSTTTSYDFKHKNLIEGIQYYRIKQVDVLNDQAEYSDIVSITAEDLPLLNVAALTKHSFNVLSAQEGLAQFKIYSTMGQIISEGTFDAVPGNQNIYYQSKIVGSGVVMIEVELNGHQERAKFIVN